MEKEIWKEVPGFNRYEISNFGRIRKEGIISPLKQKGKYLNRRLRQGKVTKSFKIHSLVAILFLKHKPCGFRLVIDHNDGNRHNNKASNLRIVTQRQNIHAGKRASSSSKYIGVSNRKKFVGPDNKKIWKATIRINGKPIFLGMFDKEFEAHLAYQKKLKETETQIF